MDGPERSTPDRTGRHSALSGGKAIRSSEIHAIRRSHQPRANADPDQDLRQILSARGAVTASDLASALLARRSLDLPLVEILRARGTVGEVDLLAALSERAGLTISDLGGDPPPGALADILPAKDALALEAVPWRHAGSAIVIATARPDQAHAIFNALPAGTRVILTLASKQDVIRTQIALYGERLARLAEGQAPASQSCRRWQPALVARRLAILGFVALLISIAQPAILTAALFGLTGLIFLANMALKIAAFYATWQADRTPPRSLLAQPPSSDRLPIVTILVPLYKEREIASTLIAHLEQLDYPRERLDVLLAIEEDDATTAQALRHTTLPPWIRCITVPPGHPRTKPRALNFALNFARGSIIGVYDAEDRPEPDQIKKVVSRFSSAGADTACLQGRLDYYNTRHNWIARCFAIEYASWFRVLLPGVQRLGLFVPLGGTTLFLRREILERIGAWDAHNVTEDAELGLRLTRLGYRTEMVDTTTFEEANAAVLPWIKQRSRWQKGYLMTWATAMRHPMALWRDLGTKRFLAFQVQILCAVAGFLVAPLLWSLLALPFGLPHPLQSVITPPVFAGLAVAMALSLIVTMALAIYATRATHLRGLRPWVAVAEFYFLLATLSAWWAAAEMLFRPFWWAKTQHGGFGGVSDAQTPDQP